jgi:uncharacterized iron-regulated protein
VFGIAGATPFALWAAEPEWIASLSGHDVVILGELHDNPEHHLNQAKAIEALSPKAVVFEMLSPEQADRLKDGVPEDATAAATLLEWADSGWPPYEIYHPVFQATGAGQIFGAALPREQVRAAVFGDAAAIFGPDAARFGLNLPLPETQQEAREAAQMSAHCDALPENMLPGMVAAQRLRDAHFARVTLAALEATGGPVVVITGNGHARADWGMPVYLAEASPGISVISVGQFEHAPEQDAPFDVTVQTTMQEREDPCDAFR